MCLCSGGACNTLGTTTCGGGHAVDIENNVVGYLGVVGIVQHDASHSTVVAIVKVAVDKVVDQVVREPHILLKAVRIIGHEATQVFTVCDTRAIDFDTFNSYITVIGTDKNEVEEWVRYGPRRRDAVAAARCAIVSLRYSYLTRVRRRVHPDIVR